MIMINESTGVLEAPYNLVTLSKATSNPMLDLGYQCSDMRPYFEYKNGNKLYYTTIHPNNIATQVINVYEEYIKNVDGVDYSSMKYIGTTTATTNTSITYEGVVYTYNNTYKNIRGFYTNKWAIYKPINIGNESELSRDANNVKNDAFIQHDCGLELSNISIPTSGGPMSDKYPIIQSMINDLKENKFFWIYRPPVVGEDWFRMTDFIGYNKNAVNPFYMEYVGGIGPINNGIKDIYIDTKENTHEIKITLGEYTKSFLPENNITTKALPTYFKNEHALGLVYESTGGDGLGFVDPYDTESSSFLYPLKQGESTEVPMTIRIGSTYTIGAYLINKDYGDEGFYFPVNPLKLRFLRIPDLLKLDIDCYAAHTKDLVVEITVTRNGSSWWWGIHRPDASVISTTVTNSAFSNDDYVTVLYRKQGSSDFNTLIGDSLSERDVIKEGNEHEWNGCTESNTQEGINIPISTTPTLSNSDSMIFRFVFEGLKDGLTGAYPTYDETKIIGYFLLGTNDSGDFRQSFSINIDDELLNKIGWSDIIGQ